MTDSIGGLAFWQVRIDADGDPEAGAADAVDEIAANRLTDLVVFSHGWNNSPDTARRLYAGWFGQLAPQLAAATSAPPVKVGLVGVFWPSQRWSDEPIPDFAPVAGAAGPVPGAAGLGGPRPTAAAPSTEVDDETLAALRETFPEGAPQLDRMATLLAAEPTPGAAEEFLKQLREFADVTSRGSDDGEGDEPDAPGVPRMLSDEPQPLFGRYAEQLRSAGVVIDADTGGAAGLTDTLRGIWHGAKEALRQVTYWQMKNRAGVVGQRGLGPLIGRIHQAAPGIRVHLVGHSFGARVVAYALAGLPADAVPSPVKSVTLLQGAFSHFAFADPLPFDAARKGALAGMLSRVDGPLVTCFSEHDDAVGRFYPLASIAAGDDAAAAADRLYRWGGMGHDGAQGVHAKLDALQPAAPGTVYRFEPGKALNIDASETVRSGGPPSGAHSDIVHPELTWVVLKAGGIVP